ncbi:hypothetical protein JCM8547_008220 [Rhodosporidiobolus lusitaniae]
MERKHVCILSEGLPLSSSSSTRFLRLPHPRTHQPALFVPQAREDGSDALLEVQKIQLEADKQRCWFIEEDICSDGSLTLFTPFDPLFLALSYISQLPSRYLSYEDCWEAIAAHKWEVEGEEKSETEGETPFAENLGRLRRIKCVRERFEKVCESQEHEGTTLYRLSQPAVLSLLQAKVDALVDVSQGVFGPLESTSPGEEKPKTVAEGEEGSPATSSRRFETVTRGLGKEVVGSGHGLSEEIQTEARQKYAIGIIANYLPPAVAQTLLSAYSFPALTTYLSSTSNSSVLGTTYLPGRGAAKLEAAELGGGSAAKKRKAEASKGSRGVEALKKVNTKGMATLASMFAKQPKAKPAEKKEAEEDEEEETVKKPAKKKRKT